MQHIQLTVDFRSSPGKRLRIHRSLAARRRRFFDQRQTETRV